MEYLQPTQLESIVWTREECVTIRPYHWNNCAVGAFADSCVPGDDCGRDLRREDTAVWISDVQNAKIESLNDGVHHAQ